MYYKDKRGRLHPVRTMQQWELADRQIAAEIANGTVVVMSHRESDYEYAQSISIN